MKQIIDRYKQRYGSDAPFELRFFHLSSLCCCIVFIANFIYLSRHNSTYAAKLLYIFACIFIIITNLISDNAKTEKAKRVPIIAFCIGLNVVFFPLIYLTSGGIHSAVAMYFILGIVFTILNLRKKALLIVLPIETIVYLTTFAISYTKPEVVSYFYSIGNDKFASVALGSVLTGLALGTVLRLITSGYENERTKADQLVEKLEDMTTRDALTGAFNRRYLMSYLDHCIERVNDGDLITFSIIMFDLDHFKRVNDTYGHVVGDVVLKSFVDVLKANMRSIDIIARYGGEEFIVVLPTSDELSTYRRADQIKSKLEEISLCDDLKERVTVSGGICGFEPSISVEAMIEKADNNLYIAKEQGRNRIAWRNGATPPVCYAVFG
ncbi:MAG: GGDEF domain-containing protein [Oscillospiraceae bacterium]